MRTLLALVVVASCAKAQDHSKLLIDRNWIDRMPQTDRDKLHVYRFVPNMGGGVFQDRTLYKGTFELFHFSAKGDELHFVLPETHQDVVSKFRIDSVDGPEPFDLKLKCVALCLMAAVGTPNSA